MEWDDSKEPIVHVSMTDARPSPRRQALLQDDKTLVSLLTRLPL